MIVDSLIVKVASRCNLNCTYCYMYNHADKSFLLQPKRMSKSVYRRIFEEVAAYCKRNSLDHFIFIIHGGEPLLFGLDHMSDFINSAKRELCPAIEPVFVLQTNGLLITPEWVEFFIEHRVHVGLSIDGPPEFHDRFRLDHTGKGSLSRTLVGLSYLQSAQLDTSALSVINPEIPADTFISFFRDIGIDRLDLLLPDANYFSPYSEKRTFHSTEVGEWLEKVFWTWIGCGRPFSVRLFEYAYGMICGKNPRIDCFGSNANSALVVETNGEIEPVDVLKICGENFTKTHVNILDASLEDALSHPLVKLYLNSGGELSKTCQQCKFASACAGGYLPHRFSTDTDFDNPSYYCNDLFLLFEMMSDLHDRVTERAVHA